MTDWKPGDYCLVKIDGKLRMGEIRETREVNTPPYGSINTAWLRLYGKRRNDENQVEIYTRERGSPITGTRRAQHKAR